MAEKPYQQTANVVSEKSNIGLSVKNLIAIVSAVGIGVWSYFGLTQRITELETAKQLMEADLLKKAEQTPVDMEQTMILEWLGTQNATMEAELESMINNKINIEFLKEQVSKLQTDVETLKDKVRANGIGE